MKDNIIQKFRDKFFEEANSLLDKFETDILELEKNPGNRELGESVFRAMHTIKGISAMYGFSYISEYTHFLENIFQSIKDGKNQLTKEISELSLLSIDHIHNLLNDEKLSDPELRSRHEKLVQQVNSLAENPHVHPDFNPSSSFSRTISTWAVIIETDEKLEFRRINLHGICRDISGLGKFRISRIQGSNTDRSEFWCIVLVTASSLDEIRDVLMFIEDNCMIFKIGNGDLLSDKHAIDSIMVTGPDASISGVANQKLTEQGRNREETNRESQSENKQKNKRLSVETGKLDVLMYLVSQLITLNSKIKVSASEQNYSSLTDHIESLDSLSKSFRDIALSIRLVPFRDITLRFQRLVRDLSKSMQKKIDLVTEGIDTELDKNILDAIVEPLIHLIRNCADHGIESTEERIKKGKPETGTIRISIKYSGNHIIIKVEDDGNGIDLEKVRIRAIEKGILDVSQAPTDQELYNIIFISGFTTARGLSEVSGRGVGMDVVKKKIADLRGIIMVDSVKGRGTTFTIRLNQSMTITDTLLFSVQDSYFILPVSEIVSCRNASTESIMQNKHTSLTEFDGELIPFIDLREYLKLEGEYSTGTKMIVIKSNDQLISLLADNIIGEHQAVLKPLVKTFDSESILSSVSQLGDGKLAFFINTVLLGRHIVIE